MTESVHPVLAAAARFKAELLRNEAESTRRLTNAYGTAYQRIGAQIEALSQVLDGQPLSQGRAIRLAQLRALREQIGTELGRFGIVAENELTQSARESVQLGINHSTGLVEAHFTSPQARQALTASFAQLVPEQVETLLGFLADDSPLRQGLTANLGAAVGDRVTDRLVDGMIRGFNPNKTAGIVRREMGVGLAWAINTVRTANLWAYREATRANYAANPRVVSGWTWLATLDGRVCGLCLSQHGSRHSLTETLNGHHQCRCTMIPELPLAKSLGLDLPEIEPGEEWFNRQGEATQRGILGPGMWQAWKEGAVNFDQFRGHTYDHPAYGEMQRMPTMGQLGMERYRTRAEQAIETRTPTAPEAPTTPTAPARPARRPRREAQTSLLDALGIRTFAASPPLPENSNASLDNVIVESDGTIAQKHLSDYRRIPDLLRAAVERAGVKVYVSNDQSVPGIDRQEKWRGVQPRGWAEGQTWDTVPGAYDAEKRYVLAGAGAGAGSSSLLLHEYGHAAGHVLGYNDDQRLIDIHTRAFSSLPSYFAQGGPGAAAGRSELLAEAFAGTITNRNAAVNRFGEEMISFIENIVFAVGDVQ